MWNFKLPFLKEVEEYLFYIAKTSAWQMYNFFAVIYKFPESELTWTLKNLNATGSIAFKTYPQ